nr:hypothetical protein [Tanacetum cinerariifolium]
MSDFEGVTTQVKDIDILKIRMKKLKKKQRSQTHKLKRLYKVGLIARVESSHDNDDLGKDAFKKGRISDIDVDEGITLVSTHDDAEMFDANQDLDGSSILIALPLSCDFFEEIFVIVVVVVLDLLGS